jgi:hypothetical protein
VPEEGWYFDPYRLHQERWFSDGVATALVRDKGATSQDPPPDSPYVDEPKLVEPAPSHAESDLQRGDQQLDDTVDAADAAVRTYFTRGGN